MPSVLQSTQDKELHSKLKKNFSVFQNALRRAQLEEGLIGDNTAVFTSSEDSNIHYESAKRLAKYLNTIKVCKDSTDTDCEGLYYPIKLATQSGNVKDSHKLSAVALADGSIYTIRQYENCSDVENDCEQDENGVCKKDENGNTIDTDWNRRYCAEVYIDVNGAKKPNKLGKDVFVLTVYQSKVDINKWSANGYKNLRDILTNKI